MKLKYLNKKIFLLLFVILLIFLGFNHTPIYYTDTYLNQSKWKLASTGFWLINSEGTDMRIIPPFQFQIPACSLDKQWITFLMSAQIFKIPFDGNNFNTTNILQLNSESRKYFSALSPDYVYIAYNDYLSDDWGYDNGTLWILNLSTGEKKQLTFNPNG